MIILIPILITFSSLVKSKNTYFLKSSIKNIIIRVIITASIIDLMTPFFILFFLPAP